MHLKHVALAILVFVIFALQTPGSYAGNVLSRHHRNHPATQSHGRATSRTGKLTKRLKEKFKGFRHSRKSASPDRGRHHQASESPDRGRSRERHHGETSSSRRSSHRSNRAPSHDSLFDRHDGYDRRRLQERRSGSPPRWLGVRRMPSAKLSHLTPGQKEAFRRAEKNGVPPTYLQDLLHPGKGKPKRQKSRSPSRSSHISHEVW
jgi:hypothetical protein